MKSWLSCLLKTQNAIKKYTEYLHNKPDDDFLCERHVCLYFYPLCAVTPPPKHQYMTPTTPLSENN